jgi:hypothetical protein
MNKTFCLTAGFYIRKRTEGAPPAADSRNAESPKNLAFGGAKGAANGPITDAANVDTRNPPPPQVKIPTVEDKKARAKENRKKRKDAIDDDPVLKKASKRMRDDEYLRKTSKPPTPALPTAGSAKKPKKKPEKPEKPAEERITFRAMRREAYIKRQELSGKKVKPRGPYSD